MSKWLIALAIMLTPSMALAHSGHGHIEDSSIWHWLLEFDHISWLVPVAVILFVVIRSNLLSRNK